MNRLKSPCQDCGERAFKCHSKCIKYKFFQVINREVNKRIRDDIRNTEAAIYKTVRLKPVPTDYFRCQIRCITCVLF